MVVRFEKSAGNSGLGTMWASGLGRGKTEQKLVAHGTAPTPKSRLGGYGGIKEGGTSPAPQVKEHPQKRQDRGDQPNSEGGKQKKARRMGVLSDTALRASKRPCWVLKKHQNREQSLTKALTRGHREPPLGGFRGEGRTSSRGMTWKKINIHGVGNTGKKGNDSI